MSTDPNTSWCEPLRTALLRAFDEPQLRMMLKEKLGVTLGAVTSPDAIGVRVFALIEKFDRESRVPEVAAARSHASGTGTVELAALVKRLVMERKGDRSNAGDFHSRAKAVVVVSRRP